MQCRSALVRPECAPLIRRLLCLGPVPDPAGQNSQQGPFLTVLCVPHPLFYKPLNLHLSTSKKIYFLSSVIPGPTVEFGLEFVK